MTVRALSVFLLTGTLAYADPTPRQQAAAALSDLRHSTHPGYVQSGLTALRTLKQVEPMLDARSQTQLDNAVALAAKMVLRGGNRAGQAGGYRGIRAQQESLNLYWDLTGRDPGKNARAAGQFTNNTMSLARKYAQAGYGEAAETLLRKVYPYGKANEKQIEKLDKRAWQNEENRLAATAEILTQKGDTAGAASALLSAGQHQNAATEATKQRMASLTRELAPALAVAKRRERTILSALGIAGDQGPSTEALLKQLPKTAPPTPSIDELKVKPFIGRAPLGDRAWRDALTRNLLSKEFDYADPNLKLASSRDQARARGVIGRVERVLQRELGVDVKNYFNGHVAVVQGSRDSENAEALRNGAVVVGKGLMDALDKVGIACATAPNHQILSDVIAQISAGTYVAPAHYDVAKARKYADASLLFVLGHEMTHQLMRDGSDLSPTSQRQRSHETRADNGGVELALRAGASPKAIVAASYWLEASSWGQGATVTVADDSHPVGAERFDRVLGLVAKHRDDARKIYDGVHTPVTGTAYMSPAMKADFDSLSR